MVRFFPNSLFYVLRFPQWPLPTPHMPPLDDNNIFCIERPDRLFLINSKEQLETFFCKRLPKVTDLITAEDAAKCWLTLSCELAQDGMYSFSIPENEVSARRKKGEIIASGSALVLPIGGNGGNLHTTLTFASSGQLLRVEEINKLQPGIRPICQSTKLLDPDPIVRRMAEQDLLVMGKAAKAYLDEQKEKASPQLKQIIEKVWEKIEFREKAR